VKRLDEGRGVLNARREGWLKDAANVRKSATLFTYGEMDLLDYTATARPQIRIGKLVENETG
jgi:hypothetical protein